MMRFRPLTRFGFLTVLLAAAALSGCGTENPIEPKRLEQAYPILSTPQDVLKALTLAYGAKDSVETKALYDLSYVGTSENLGDPPGTLPSSFRYADEVNHVVALRRGSTIGGVHLYLGLETGWARQGSDDLAHPDWAVIQVSGSTLKVEITDGGSDLVVNSPSEFFQFTFRPTVQAPTDTLWKIVRWREVGTSY
jgi:hypothetical protein